MSSSDDEAEVVPRNVSEYEFACNDDEPISFAVLPMEWCKGGGTRDGSLKQVFLRGKTDNGLRKLYKQVTAWKFDLSCNRKKPEISVLSVEGHWIKLVKPRRAFEVVIRTILITVNFLHFVKWNPQKSHRALWDHLTKTFSMFENKPSEDDLTEHMSLIHEAVKRDETLAKSQLWLAFLEKKPRKRKTPNEELNPSFIVDDCSGEEDQNTSEDDESDDEDDCFDSVCAICDNGGHIYLCEGKCMRSFHGTVEGGEESNCASLGFTEEEVERLKGNEDFYCLNCEHKKHQCFSCGKLGSSDESSGAEVFRCVNGACGHFYHPDCVAKLLHPGDEAATEEHRQRIVAGEQFACPVHRCHVCNEVEVRSDPPMQFAVCRRCPRAYHRKCLPRGIASEEDVKEGRAPIQRAWEGLMPNRLLIYCLKHKIDVRISTPTRNHIIFPGQRKDKVILPKEITKDQSKDRSASLGNRSTPKLSTGVEKVPSASKKGDHVRKRVDKLPEQGSSKKQKVVVNRSPTGNLKQPSPLEGNISLGDRIYATLYGSGSETDEPIEGERLLGGNKRNEKFMPPPKKISYSVTLDADAEKRIMTLIRDASSCVTPEEIRQKHKGPSTHAHSSRFAAENVTLGKVEGSVEAVRAALAKLDKGGSVQDAKAVCGNDLLVQVTKWKEKLKVYLAPFIYGMRYTSFGRHFTKTDKLSEIVDILRWYVEDDDMIVDFCCGSNDFSCFMKKKLDKMEKRCLFKNYDILQAKNDFSFERRDWMKVQKDELPEGSRLIMGLNPPFGVNASLANKFINKALEFKPKLLILIVPRETQRLDEKESPYDLIWEDDQLLAGKSFYLPGSVDVNDKQIEDWNMSAPVLYLWSRPDLTSKHKAIAEQHGHVSGALMNCKLEESHESKHVSTVSHEPPKFDETSVAQVEAGQLDKQKDQEEEPRVVTRQEEALPLGRGTEGDNNNHGKQNYHSEQNQKDSGGKRKKKRGGKKKAAAENKSPVKRPASSHHSPILASERRERQPPQQIPRVRRDDYQQFNHGNFPTHQSHPQTRDDEDLVMRYGVAPNPHYGFSGVPERHLGHPDERMGGYSHMPYVGEVGQRYASNLSRPPPQMMDYPPYAGPVLPSYGHQLNPVASTAFGGINTSAMHRYAPRLDEMDHARMNNPMPGPPVPRPTFQLGSSGFAPGPHRPPYPNHNSSGWLNE